MTVAAVLVVMDLARGGGRDASAVTASEPAAGASAAAPVAKAPTAPPSAPVTSTPVSKDVSVGPDASAGPTGLPGRNGPGRLSGRDGEFAYAGGPGPVLGVSGTLRRFRVAVEESVEQDATGFAGAVDRILGDVRSWVAGGRLRLQRVPRGAPAEFTIYLATPDTSARMCAVGGLDTQRYTSCRLSGQVIINLTRWLAAVPGYGAPLADYQAYAVNHEVGHQLGYGHEACPEPGRPAPVMQQQTLGLRGCTAYGWPYLDGRRYAGPPVS